MKNILDIFEEKNDLFEIELYIYKNDRILFIKESKGNIKIKTALLGKYNNAEEIFLYEHNNGKTIEITKELNELKKINIYQLSIKEVKRLAKCLYCKYNKNENIVNEDIKIYVTGKGIEESINKIFENKNNRCYLKEHLLILSNLDKIIKEAKLVNQAIEYKKRSNINYWNYFFVKVIIANQKLDLVLDIRSMDNGENQYRVQRIKKSITQLRTLV